MLVSLDALFSFSEAAAAALKLYVCPELHDKFVGIMMLDQVRHPCLEVEVLDGMSFIASVSFGMVRQSVSVCKKSAYTVCRCSSPSP